MPQPSSTRNHSLALPLVGGNWPAFTPNKAPNVMSRHKACRQCEAQPGEPCINSKGNETAPHRVRRRAAIRERNNA